MLTGGCGAAWAADGGPREPCIAGTYCSLLCRATPAGAHVSSIVSDPAWKAPSDARQARGEAAVRVPVKTGSLRLVVQAMARGVRTLYLAIPSQEHVSEVSDQPSTRPVREESKSTAPAVPVFWISHGGALGVADGVNRANFCPAALVCNHASSVFQRVICAALLLLPR